VRIEVIAEEEDRVVVAGREETRESVVDEVALVDRLDCESETRLRQWREDRRAVTSSTGPQRLAPERSFALGVEGDLLPEVNL
jgi:hypothetical protein